MRLWCYPLCYCRICNSSLLSRYWFWKKSDDKQCFLSHPDACGRLKQTAESNVAWLIIKFRKCPPQSSCGAMGVKYFKYITFPPVATSPPIFLLLRDDIENKCHGENIGNTMNFHINVFPELHFIRQTTEIWSTELCLITGYTERNKDGLTYVDMAFTLQQTGIIHHPLVYPHTLSSVSSISWG